MTRRDDGLNAREPRSGRSGKKRIAVVTSGHLSTCPRMLKAADALAVDGHEVHVVSTRFMRWAAEADEQVRTSRRDRWRWTVVDYTREEAPWRYAISGVRWRLYRALARYRSSSFPAAARAVCRVHEELVRAALATGADSFYGGTVGGLGATFEAARRAGREYGLDLEDFYSGNHPDDPVLVRIVERIEAEVLKGARFLTAASDGIAEAYREKFGVEAVTIHNTFPLPAEEPEPSPASKVLKLYWFSQTIGRGRGLEDAVEAIRRAGISAELHLRGSPDAAYVEGLENAIRQNVPELRLVVHEPAPPDDMVSLLRGYDVGLAIEPPVSVNRDLCLSNKVFTYILGGLALVMTTTTGHQRLIDELEGECVAYAPGDVDALAAGLDRLANDEAFRERCGRASWEAARRRWHWEHPRERGRLLELVGSDG